MSCYGCASVSDDLPTRTEVRPSSSEALLPPPALLLMLIRELLLGAGLTIALRGRGGRFPGDGDVGGLAIVGGKRGRSGSNLRQALSGCRRCPHYHPRRRDCETQKAAGAVELCSKCTTI